MDGHMNVESLSVFYTVGSDTCRATICTGNTLLCFTAFVATFSIFITFLTKTYFRQQHKDNAFCFTFMAAVVTLTHQIVRTLPTLFTIFVSVIYLSFVSFFFH
jgi:hypothetical protein